MLFALREIIRDLQNSFVSLSKGSSRRKFFLFIASALGSIVVYFGWFRRVWVPVAPLASIPSETFLPFTARGASVFIRRSPNDEVIALSQRCSHQGCFLAWRSAVERFECPCHEGRFTETGALISGAPIRPLDRFDTRIEAGVVEVLL